MVYLVDNPSLDEMVHVAKEMERMNFKIPLLIGELRPVKNIQQLK
ncbi:MAG: hypothetical protein Ct9H90mP7_0660 [Candidatus Neomarinimicrobiota bacterium]|nr:MAG: hypothetical protein Ct9H90mP7_0660 [Candidatus Neomarinimicrobiota bacterium]